MSVSLCKNPVMAFNLLKHSILQLQLKVTIGSLITKMGLGGGESLCSFWNVCRDHCITVKS